MYYGFSILFRPASCNFDIGKIGARTENRHKGIKKQPYFTFSSNKFTKLLLKKLIRTDPQTKFVGYFFDPHGALFEYSEQNLNTKIEEWYSNHSMMISIDMTFTNPNLHSFAQRGSTHDPYPCSKKRNRRHAHSSMKEKHDKINQHNRIQS